MMRRMYVGFMAGLWVAAIGAGLVTPIHAADEARKFGRLVWSEVNASGDWTSNAGPFVSLQTKVFHPVSPPPSIPYASGAFLEMGEAGAKSFPRLLPAVDYTGMGVIFGSGPGVYLDPTDKKAKGAGTLQIQQVQATAKSVKIDFPNPPAGSGYFFSSFSPDGRTVYFTRVTPGAASPPGDPVGPPAVENMLMSADVTATPINPTPLSVKGTYPAVSPNGKLLAFVEQAEDARTQRVVVVSLSDLANHATKRHYEVTIADARQAIRPSWRVDSAAIALSTNWRPNLAEESWTCYAFPVDPDNPPTMEQFFLESRAVQISDNDAFTDATWPCFSADGQSVAYVTKRRNERSKLCTRKVGLGLSASAASEDAGDCQGDAVGLNWAGDAIPPSLRVELVPADSSQSNVVKILPTELVSLANGRLVTKAQARGQGAHFNRTMKPASGPPGPAELTADLKFNPDATPVTLALNLSKDIPYEPPGKTKVPSVTGSSLGATSGLYVTENVRIQVKISAKDNQFLRFHPGSVAPTPGDLLSWKADENPIYFPEGDPRSLAPGARPPYLPLMNRSDAFNKRYPGVSWWWEDSKGEPLDTGTNATEFIPRAGNFTGDEQAAKEKIIWFHAVAQDLWQNRTELTVPVFVYSSTFTVDRLSFGESRRK